MAKHVRTHPEFEPSRLSRPLADHPDNVGRQLAAAFRTEQVNAVGAFFRALQKAYGIGLQRVGRPLAALDPANPEGSISRGVQAR